MAAHPGFRARGDGHVERARAGIDAHLTRSASAALRSATDPAPPRLPLHAGYPQQPGRAPPTVGVLRAWRRPRRRIRPFTTRGGALVRGTARSPNLKIGFQPEKESSYVAESRRR